MRRKIRSFVKREGRTSKRQANAVKELLPKYGINFSDTPIDLSKLFQYDAPVTLEIGFGMGDSLAQMAMTCPATNFIGIEVHKPGVGSLLATIGENDINNIRIFHFLIRVRIHFPAIAKSSELRVRYSGPFSSFS